ncbi:MAG: hypothetical protein EBX98_05245, partial [Burkholderiaceae bacterium]|nr:hypothetical protein [Burkholderiaceae bacterium]
MATLRVSNVEALNITQKTGSGIITMQTGTSIATQTPQAFTSPGQIVQARYFRTDVRANYTASQSGDGNRITDINLTITPKFATSLLLMQWMINGELHQDAVFVVHRDNALVTTSGFTGYNAQCGNSRWSGMVSAFYDQNQDSTPSNWFIQYAAPAVTISPTIFSLAVRGSGPSDYTFSLNRT